MSNNNREHIEKIWKDRFAREDESIIQQNFERVAMQLSTTEDEYLDFLYILEKEYFCCGGRVMANAGVKGLTMNNCFVLPMIDDSYEGIFDTIKIAAITHRASGGTGFDFSNIRPKGSPTSKGNVASGAISFMNVFNEATETTIAGNRRGANMGVMSIYSMDIEDFINAKAVEGKLQHFNLSVMVDDFFMHAVEKNEDIYLHYPVYDKYGKIIYDSTKWVYSKEINAKELWDKITKKAYDNGEPGVLFYDTMNDMNNVRYLESITATNPSLRKGTEILTDKGVFPIEDLQDKKITVQNLKGEWVEAECFLSGSGKTLYEIELENSTKYYATKEHKWAILNNNRYTKTFTEDLEQGDLLPYTVNHSLPFGEEGTYEDGLFIGFWYGDGCVTTRKDDGRKQYNFTVGLEKAKSGFLNIVQNKLSKITEKEINYYTRNRGKEDWYEFCCSDKKLNKYMEGFGVYEKSIIPNDMLTKKSEDFRKGFIDGIFSSDGHITSPNANVVNMGLTSSKREFLEQIQNILNWYGIMGRINHSSTVLNEKTFVGYNLRFSHSTLLDFRDIFTLTNKNKQKRLQTARDTSKRMKKSTHMEIKSIKETNLKEDVWDIRVYDDSHTFRISQVITGNCGEFLAGTIHPNLSKGIHSEDYGGACNLGSLMLHNFVKKPFTTDAFIDYSTLSRVIKIAIRLLDNVIDINNYPDKIYENYQQSLRTIGLGVNGLANMLVMMGLNYGEKTAILFVDKLMNFITREAYIASIELAEEKGAFPMFEADEFLKSKFLKQHIENDKKWEYVYDQIKEHGIRNARLISVAPTGSISLVFGKNCSSGIEPIFALETKRQIKIGGQTDDKKQEIVIQDRAYEIYESYCDSGVDHLITAPPFVTALELSPQQHIDMLEVIAKHVDMSISKTINIPEEASFSEVQDIYLQCWKKGIKGCTIFRPNELRQGILSDSKVSGTMSPKEQKSLPEANTEPSNTILERGVVINIDDDVIGRKRKLITGCGSLHCVAMFDPVSGNLTECYLSKGSTGGCNNFMIGLSRMISFASRLGGDIYDIIDQLKSCGVCPSYAVRTAVKTDTSKGSCCPIAVGYALKEMYEEIQDLIGDEEIGEEVVTIEKIKKEFPPIQEETKTILQCPKCGEQVDVIGGCQSCLACGWSKCE